MTDLHPIVELCNDQYLGDPRIIPWPHPIRANNLDTLIEKLKQDGIVQKVAQLFTFMESVFHHLQEGEAKLILDFVKRYEGTLLLIEPFERNFKSIVLAALGFFVAFISSIAFFTFSFQQKRYLDFFGSILFFWIIPVIPFFFLFDGIVSAFRQRDEVDFSNLNSLIKIRSIKTNLGRNKVVQLLRLS